MKKEERPGFDIDDCARACGQVPFILRHARDKFY